MTRRETVSRLVPAPLAAITLLLVVVILLTPVLDLNGPPVAGTLQTQAEQGAACSNGIISTVRAMPGAIGYVGVSYLSTVTGDGEGEAALGNWPAAITSCRPQARSRPVWPASPTPRPTRPCRWSTARASACTRSSTTNTLS